MKDYVKEFNTISNACKNILADYAEAKEIVDYEQSVMRDVAHKLELCRTTSIEREKLATIYANAARRRRTSKDIVNILHDFVRFCEIHSLESVFCEFSAGVQHEKERQAVRTYTPRTNKIHFDGVAKYGE
jgi:regulatory protein YycI of two-component signal transduction system YycFG